MLDSRLRSKPRGDFITPWCRLRSSDKAFAISASTAWNCLYLLTFVETFKKHLKSLLFNVAFNQCRYSNILLFKNLFYGAVELWLSGALASVGDMMI